MLFSAFVLVLCVFNADAVFLNGTCPVVAPRELDWKDLDGKWYLAAIATDMPIQGDCAMVQFSHKNDNSTDLSVSWVENNTVSYYNGSVNLSVDPNSNETVDGDVLIVTFTDEKEKTFSFLTVDYEHYALMFACSDNDDNGTSDYEIWELTRAPHAKPKHVSKIFNALATYDLNGTEFFNFNNQDDTCRINGAIGVLPSSFVLSALGLLMVVLKW